MGSYSSKLNQKQWDKATGGLYNATQTIDRSEPSLQYINSKLSLDAPLALSMLDYFTRPVKKNSRKGFDVFSRKHKGEETPILRVLKTRRRIWTVFAYNHPSWENQKADEVASESACTSHSLYRMVSIEISTNRGHTAHVYRYERGEISGMNKMNAILRLEHVAGRGGYQTLKPKRKDPYNSVTKSKDNNHTLVGYWDTQMIHLVPGVDVALHVVLSTIATNVGRRKQQVRAAPMEQVQSLGALPQQKKLHSSTISMMYHPKVAMRLTTLREYLRKNNVAAVMINCILHGIDTYLLPNTPHYDFAQHPTGTFLHIVRRAYVDQTQIGWSNFLRGRHATMWLNAHDHYHSTTLCHLRDRHSSNHLGQRIILHCWDYRRRIWFRRNEDTHGENSRASKDILVTKLHKKITDAYNDPTLLSDSDRAIVFNSSLAKQLAKPLHSKPKWYFLYQSCLDAPEAAAAAAAAATYRKQRTCPTRRQRTACLLSSLR